MSTYREAPVQVHINTLTYTQMRMFTRAGTHLLPYSLKLLILSGSFSRTHTLECSILVSYHLGLPNSQIH